MVDEGEWQDFKCSKQDNDEIFFAHASHTLHIVNYFVDR